LGVSPERMQKQLRSGETPKPQTAEDALLRLPLWAYPDRVCRRRANDPAAGVMVGGGGVRLAPESIVRQHEFFIALDARQDQRSNSREAIVQIASGIEVQWLEEMFPQEIRRERNAIYDEQRGRVVAHGTISYRDLVLREDKDAPVDAKSAEGALAEYVTPDRARELLRSDERAGRWLARLEFLRRVMPDRGFPAIGGDEVREAAKRASIGKRSLDQLRPALIAELEGLLVYPLDRLLETEAPDSIEVPTGNRIKLEYPLQSDTRDEIAPPVLAVRLQEMFGMTETPRVAGGRVAVRLHLLGPNYRPVQITDDLKSFWSTTYFQVRKDLRVRYPKHAWPNDPLAARPEAKGSRRR
jgi:ATP-dependent helicase HrpB